MLQIAIWGIASILVVQGFAVLHQQALARAAGHMEGKSLSTIAIVIAFVSAAGILVLSTLVAAIPTGGTPLTAGDADNMDAMANQLDARAGNLQAGNR